MERQLPDLASALARSIQTGATLLGALQELSKVMAEPVRHELVETTRQVARGSLLDDALVDWQRRCRAPGIDLLVPACRFGYAEGGDLTAALDGVSVALLDRIELADEARAMSSQARTSAAALVVLPILGVVGFSVLDPRVPSLLLGSPLGWLCLLVGLTLNALGALTTTLIVRSTLR